MTNRPQEYDLKREARICKTDSTPSSVNVERSIPRLITDDRLPLKAGDKVGAYTPAFSRSPKSATAVIGFIAIYMTKLPAPQIILYLLQAVRASL